MEDQVEHGFQGSDNYSWSNDQSLLGSARTPKIRMRVKESCNCFGNQSRMTMPHCAPSRWQLITNMQNRHVHHLISTNLHVHYTKKSVQYYLVLLKKQVSLVHHGAHYRSVMHNTSRWWTTQLCTIEVVHNVAFTNPIETVPHPFQSKSAL